MRTSLLKMALSTAAVTVTVLTVGQGVALASTTGNSVAGQPLLVQGGEKFSPDDGAKLIWTTNDGANVATFELRDIAADGLVPRLEYQKGSGAVSVLENHNGYGGEPEFLDRTRAQWPAGTSFSIRVCNVGSGQLSNPCGKWYTYTI